MTSEPLMMACVGDIAGQVRGKGFPVADLRRRIANGVGWTPANAQITCFDTIAPSPYGSFGDVVLWPDPATEVRVVLLGQAASEHLILGDITHLDGRPWECCLRSILRRALDRLHERTGLELIASFEHELMMKGDLTAGTAFSLTGFRAGKAFGETFLGALRQAEIVPDSFLREYGRHQYEVTVDPQPALRAADHAMLLRELARAVATAHDCPITFTPLLDPKGVGNGVHIHLSFRDAKGEPATRDPNGAHGLSATAAAFVAGMLKYMPAIVALTAPSLVSYTRLTPHRWSAAFNNLGVQDREAGVRICPTPARDEAGRARQLNVEYRAADGAANPHLALAAVVAAGLQGIEEKLPAPPATQEDLSLLSAKAQAARGLRRLPVSLAAALGELEASDLVRSWFPDGFVDIYLAHKRGELAFVEGLTEAETCAAYAEVY